MSYSRTQRRASGEAQTCNPSISSQALYQLATALLTRLAGLSIKKFYNLEARGEFNNASAHGRSFFWYLSFLRNV